MHMRAAGMRVGRADDCQRESFGMIAQMLHDALGHRDEEQTHRRELFLVWQRQIGIKEGPLIHKRRLNRTSHGGASRIVMFSGMQHEMSARFDAGG
jgi:hypothetical protein